MKKLVLTNLFLGVPTENRTQISRFKVLCANHYTMGTWRCRRDSNPHAQKAPNAFKTNIVSKTISDSTTFLLGF